MQAHGLILARSDPKSISLQIISCSDASPVDTIAMKGTVASIKKIPADVQKRLVEAFASPRNTPETTPAPVEIPAAKPAAEMKPSGETKPVAEAIPTPISPRADEVAPKPEAIAQSSPMETTRSTDDEKRIGTAAPGAWLGRLGVGFRGFSRTFQWSGNPSNNLADYNLVLGPSIAVDAQWFPLAHFMTGLPSYFGAYVDSHFALGVASHLAQDESKFGTKIERHRLGLLFRMPLVSILSVQAHAGYSTQTYAIAQKSADGTTRPNIPSVEFNGPRAGIGLHLTIIGPLSFEALGGFQLVTGQGELASEQYFPKATAMSVDASAALSLRLANQIHLRLGFDWTRYFVTLSAAEGATFFATSAADQTLAASLALEWVL